MDSLLSLFDLPKSIKDDKESNSKVNSLFNIIIFIK